MSGGCHPSFPLFYYIKPVSMGNPKTPFGSNNVCIHFKYKLYLLNILSYTKYRMVAPLLRTCSSEFSLLLVTADPVTSVASELWET